MQTNKTKTAISNEMRGQENRALCEKYIKNIMKDKLKSFT